MAKPRGYVRQFFAVPIHTFSESTRAIPFDVFLQISGQHFAHVFSKTTGIDYKRLTQFMNRGVEHLFVQESERAVFEEFTQTSAMGIFDREEEPFERKITALLNVTEQNLTEVFYRAPLKTETLNRTREVVKRYVQLTVESPKMLASILGMISRGEYLYFHSIAVSVFGLFVARASGKFTDQEIEEVGLASFLHDLGFSRLPGEIKDYSEEADDFPPDEVKDHVALSVSMLKDAPFKDEKVQRMVAQHHERMDGKGYPYGLKGKDIDFGTRILSASDVFCALISHRNLKGALTPEEAIARMSASTGRYDPEVLGMLGDVFLRGSGKSKGKQAA